MWLLAFEFGIMRQFKPGTGSAGKVSMLMLIIAAAWMVTAYFFGFWDITLNLVIPIALAATIITNFVLAMIDRNGNSMGYLYDDWSHAFCGGCYFQGKSDGE